MKLKKNNFIIKDVIRWKVHWKSKKKNFRYQNSRIVKR